MGCPRRGRRGLGAMVLAVAVTVTTFPTDAPATTRYWGQAQGHLASFNGMPLLAANWHGRYRPYVFDHGRFRALLPRGVGDSRLDLLRPVPLSATEILLAGSEAGRPEYDLYRWDARAGTLVNLTATPTVDDGQLCVLAARRLIAYRAGDEERVARIGDALEPLVHDARLPGFEHCAWIDGRTFVGIERRATEYRLDRCVVDTADTVACRPQAALDGVDDVTALLGDPGAPLVVIARRQGDLFRRPFRLNPPFATLVPAPGTPRLRGDILDLLGTEVRWSLHGRYRDSRLPGSTATVYATRRIGGTLFAIVATERMPRTLARARPGGWEILQHPCVAVPVTVSRPREIWMRSATGEVYQAFYFGPPAPRRMVVWWHGGPAESVSPRFNPYFLRLNELGFGVLAVNYPGSTSRGSEYEHRFADPSLADCIAAVWTFLRENDVRVVVSWSVSAGNAVQGVLLRQGVAVSALVDQAGWGRSTLLEDSRRLGIPFFAIRGRNDSNAPIAHVDYWYPDGHDITTADDFAGMFDALEGFLGAAPAVRWAAPPEDAGRPRLDIPDDATSPPDARALGFEFATHLARDCFAAGEVRFTRNASVDLSPGDRLRRASERDAGAACVSIRLGGARPPARCGARGFVLQAIDARAAGERAALRVRTLRRDGTFVRPRLERAARALCPRLRALLARR